MAEPTLSDPGAMWSHIISTCRKTRGKNNRGGKRAGEKSKNESLTLEPLRNQGARKQRGGVERVEAGHGSCGGNPPKQKHICLLLHHWALPCHASPTPPQPHALPSSFLSEPRSFRSEISSHRCRRRGIYCWAARDGPNNKSVWVK